MSGNWNRTLRECLVWVLQLLELQLGGLIRGSNILVRSFLTSLVLADGFGRTSSGAPPQHGSRWGVRMAKVNVPRENTEASSPMQT